MKTCPCCSNQLLRHIRNHDIYWFCRSCRQEMPVWEAKSFDLSTVFASDGIPNYAPVAKLGLHR